MWSPETDDGDDGRGGALLELDQVDDTEARERGKEVERGAPAHH